MKRGQISGPPRYRHHWSPTLFLTVSLLMVCGLMIANAQAFTLNVVDGQTGDAIGVGYRWLVEKDETYQADPNDPSGTNWATKFHKSYMTVEAKGHSSDALPDLDAGRYYVSVLPDSGYSIGGGQLNGNGTATVYVQPNPIPTAQISVLVFHDNNPINNAPDLPQETPGTEPGQTDMSGFTVKLEDAGGRYGASAGEAFQDAYGNPLGTTYNADGSVATMGNGFLTTGPDGQVTFQNLAPGKYGVIVIPPAGRGWQQTSTIEGKKVIDAWVKANEPVFFAEFGPPGWHAFVGFTKQFTDATALSGGQTISGQVVNNHLSRPPDNAFYDGAPFPHTTPWVGLNADGGTGRAIYVGPTDGGAFSIPNVPDGNYQLVVFDENLDLVFASHGVTIQGGQCLTPNGSCNLGNIPVNDWFSHFWAYVFNDENENGEWDSTEVPIPEMAINLRWRDGSLYQTAPTDGEGYVPFDETFPFFNWLMTEVDFATRKATGATIVVDAGGPIDPNDPWSFEGQLNPQIQADGSSYRVETGPVLTQAFQGFLGQTSVVQFGKKEYGIGENGGISGIVYYATTRAEDDPRIAAVEPWEPGIPRVTVNLYDSTGATLLATTTTDSWDDSLPTECPGDNAMPPGSGVGANACFDGMRNWNQVRPGVFDGGYAFGPEIDCDPSSEDFIFTDQATCLANTTEVINSTTGIASRYLNTPAEYVVQVIPPDGYEIVKSQDRNVDFGDGYTAPELEPAVCVGNEYTVPENLSLFPEPAPLAGETLNLCDRKLVVLGQSDNAAADFFLFTEVPIAGHIVGMILDDTANEFDPNSPQFGEKYAPPWIPVGIYDWTGRQIGSTLSDQWGVYNALVPSTYTMNLPMPSGASPNMVTTCMNDRDAAGYGDYFKNQYSTFCYTFQYMPGTTTYLDTPVVPVAAMAGPDQFPLDCELPDGTPRIDSVSAPLNGYGGGPYVPGPGMQIVISSVGALQVPNPAYDGPGGANPSTIERDYGFGNTPGSVSIGGVPLTNVTWTNDEIRGIVAAETQTGQLVVTRSDLRTSVNGVTVQVGLRNEATVRTVAAGGSIQAAIDAAGANDLILVAPGVYKEFVIMWKPVQLQGWGAGSTVIDAVKGVAGERLQVWRDKAQALVQGNDVTLLPGQEAVFGGIEPVALFTEEAAGVLVLPKSNGNTRFNLNRNQGARIDGFTIRGADQGGGITVNGYADYLEISNNVVTNNAGFFGGGIRVGHPELAQETNQGLVYTDADNDFVTIHNNMISLNGGQGGAGGGVSLCSGSDGYRVTGNWICGNFNLADGGGIGHLGLSENGLIEDNDILFNESFNQGLTVQGGGIYIAGHAPLAGGLSPGSGSVTINRNRILGNLAGAGDGGGIALVRVNGSDVSNNRNNADNWYRVNLFNNIVANNITALAGGGISLQDVATANIIHNTVAHNDSTATAGIAFTTVVDPATGLTESTPQPAGIVSRSHSTALNAALGSTGNRVPANLKVPYANPQLRDTIVWQNRSFYFFGDSLGDPPVYELQVNPDGQYWDLAVLGAAGSLNPQYSVLTDTAGYDGTNVGGDPNLIDAYVNGGRGLTVLPGEPGTGIIVPPAFDEGGNFIQVRFGPLTMEGTDRDTLYHIGEGSAVDTGGTTDRTAMPALNTDFDGDARPNAAGTIDIGGDELP